MIVKSVTRVQLRPKKKTSEPTASPQKRVVVYVPEDDYERLKQKLANEGHSVSWWFREKVAEKLSKGR